LALLLVPEWDPALGLELGLVSEQRWAQLLEHLLGQRLGLGLERLLGQRLGSGLEHLLGQRLDPLWEPE
jgi:hypothetical protein